MTLSASNVSVRLGERTALDNITLSIPADGLVALVGPNGAGKSTLLRVLAGLLTPDRGTITFHGTPLAEFDPRRRAREIAYLPQDRTVHWGLSARQTVALGRIPHLAPGAPLSRADDAVIDKAMATMDVATFAARPVTELSGGERARVLIARALAQAPRVLLADEPTAGLDPAHQLALFETLRNVARPDASVVIALHDLSLAARYCAYAVLVDRGKVIAQGAIDDVLSTDRLAAIYGIRARWITVDGVPVIVPLSASP
jgi:iron complex transport system ATP-binding protein